MAKKRFLSSFFTKNCNFLFSLPWFFLKNTRNLPNMCKNCVKTSSNLSKILNVKCQKTSIFGQNAIFGERVNDSQKNAIFLRPGKQTRFSIKKKITPPILANTNLQTSKKKHEKKKHKNVSSPKFANFAHFSQISCFSSKM